MTLNSDISLVWVDGYRPECPVCREPTTTLTESLRPVEVVEPGRGRHIERRPVSFLSPCGCRISDEQSLSISRAAVADGGLAL